MFDSVMNALLNVEWKNIKFKFSVILGLEN